MYRVDIMKHFYGTFLSIPNIAWIFSSVHHSPSLPKSWREKENMYESTKHVASKKNGHFL
jgi:hypothetical protein